MLKKYVKNGPQEGGLSKPPKAASRAPPGGSDKDATKAEDADATSEKSCTLSNTRQAANQAYTRALAFLLKTLRE